MKTFEYTTSHTAGKIIVTTDANLKGKGIKQISCGATNSRGLKKYQMTEAALKKTAPRNAIYKS